MQWTGEGLIIGVRRHGESSVIVEAMTPDRGRHLGLVRGGRSRKNAATLQPGNWVHLQWRARLEEHLGAFVVELVRARAADMIADRLSLYMGQIIFAHLRLLPERDPHPQLLEYALEILESDDKLCAKMQMLSLFELTLLDELGFGLDLSACALTGQTSGLTHISPKSGRAVTAEAAGAYLDRLLKLPPFFLHPQRATESEVLDAMQVTGFFMGRHIWDVRNNSCPPERDQLLSELKDQLYSKK